MLESCFYCQTQVRSFRVIHLFINSVRALTPRIQPAWVIHKPRRAAREALMYRPRKSEGAMGGAQEPYDTHTQQALPYSFLFGVIAVPCVYRERHALVHLALHANIVHDDAFLIFEPGNEEMVPKWGSIALVVEQASSHVVPAFYSFANFLDCFSVSIRPLQKPAIHP